jgi:hypothetical protein
MGKIIKISIDPYSAQNSTFPKWLQANLAYILLILGSYPEVNLFLKLDQPFLCIISYGRGMDYSS